jgi:hypothetical protein
MTVRNYYPTRPTFWAGGRSRPASTQFLQTLRGEKIKMGEEFPFPLD